jgi:hypothetical protein
MSTATRTRIFDLPPDERREAYDDAMERVMDAARESAAEYKARKPDPRSIHDYRGYHTMRMVCVLVVKSSRAYPNSVQCTRDGTGAPFYIPNSKKIAQPESTDDFLLCVIPKWLADVDHLALQGVTPELCAERPWTDAQRDVWERLTRARSIINTNIYFAKKRPASVLSRSAVA